MSFWMRWGVRRGFYGETASSVFGMGMMSLAVTYTGMPGKDSHLGIQDISQTG